MSSDIRKIPTRWRDSILICRKCGKKISGGFGPKGRTRLDKALRAELGVGKGRKAPLAIMEVGCFDICPKNAITVVRTGAPDVLHIVPRGAGIDAVIAALELEAYRADGKAKAKPEPEPEPESSGEKREKHDG